MSDCGCERLLTTGSVATELSAPCLRQRRARYNGLDVVQVCCWSLMATCFLSLTLRPGRAQSSHQPYVFGLIPPVRCLPSLSGLVVLENLMY
jgi:hypothetical protein